MIHPTDDTHVFAIQSSYRLTFAPSKRADPNRELGIFIELTLTYGQLGLLWRGLWNRRPCAFADESSDSSDRCYVTFTFVANELVVAKGNSSVVLDESEVHRFSDRLRYFVDYGR